LLGAVGGAPEHVAGPTPISKSPDGHSCACAGAAKKREATRRAAPRMNARFFICSSSRPWLRRRRRSGRPRAGRHRRSAANAIGRPASKDARRQAPSPRLMRDRKGALVGSHRIERHRAAEAAMIAATHPSNKRVRTIGAVDVLLVGLIQIESHAVTAIAVHRGFIHHLISAALRPAAWCRNLSFARGICPFVETRC
jgi:hypothetical protein